MSAQHVLDFWFDTTHKPFWFAQNQDFDVKIAQKFSTLYTQAVAGELWSWRNNALGRLAEIIVLDQFSRNLFREQAQAFSADGMALLLSQEAIAQGADIKLSPEQRSFLYMPFMHSESQVIQTESLRLFAALNRPLNLDFAQRHEAIIARFGRYPHRNAVLGRTSTPAELAFLQTPDSHF